VSDPVISPSFGRSADVDHDTLTHRGLLPKVASTMNVARAAAVRSQRITGKAVGDHHVWSHYGITVNVMRRSISSRSCGTGQSTRSVGRLAHHLRQSTPRGFAVSSTSKGVMGVRASRRSQS
jgi:hypothetical protein